MRGCGGRSRRWEKRFAFLAIAAALTASAADFHVAPNGDDANPGTAAKPFASLTRARDAVRSAKFRAPNRDYEFLLREGVHGLTQNRRLLPRRLRLKPESPGLKLGFRQIDRSQIGLLPQHPFFRP